MSDLTPYIRQIEKEFQDSYIDMYPESIAKTAEYKYKDERLAMAVKNVTIVVTEACQLRCKYCYQHAKNSLNVLNEETARKIVDLLFEEDARDNKYVNQHIAQALVLDFIGGEPLMNIKIISYFMRYFKWKALQLNHRWAIHYMISISSNGVAYMNPEVQKFLMIHKGRVSITLTLDGNKALHDACRVFEDGRPSYDIVAKATHHAQSVFGLGKGTKLTLAPANIIHLSDAVKNLYESFDFDGVHANCVYELGWEIEHAKIMYSEMKKLADWMLENEVQKHFYCSLFDPIIGKPQGIEDNQNYCGGVCGSMLAFTTQGNITPCLRYTQFNLNNAQPEIRMGDLETGIGNDPKYDAMIDVVNGITRRSQSTDECFNCPISTGCGWCSAYNYEIYGTPNKRCTSICPMHKARVMANIYFWNSLYRKYNLPDRFACNIPQEWALEIITKDEFDLLEALAEP